MSVQPIEGRRKRSGASHGWKHLDAARKRELIDAIVSGKPTAGPAHLELNITDRCNVACYFCSQQDLRTREQICYERLVEILDELIPRGLRSVRMSGGGDPLFHPDIVRILEYLGSRGVVLDNITTNGVAMTAPVSELLVRYQCRDVMISLNAADRDDYKRMMAVKPDRFDRIIENVQHLLKVRGGADHPLVSVQFLLDRQNYHRFADMYRLGRSLHVDRVSVGFVGPIADQKFDWNLLLSDADGELLRPYLEEVLEADRDAGLLQMFFTGHVVNAIAAEIQFAQNAGDGPQTGASFKDENGACFFGWYSTVLRGNGDLHPCCLMQVPGVATVGNAQTGSFMDQWNGPAYTRMREEMREVFLTGGQIPYNRAQFKYLEPMCVKSNECWLKNMFFRADEDFYRDLGEALEKVRRREVRWIGTPRQTLRRAGMFVNRSPRAMRIYTRLHNGTRPFRHWLRDYLRTLKDRRTQNAER